MAEGLLEIERVGGAQRPSRNPATGALLGSVALQGASAIEGAVRAAREAQPAWAATPVRERAAVLKRFQEALVADMDALARLIHAEQGKPIAEALSVEIIATLGELRWLIRHAPALLKERRVSGAQPLFAAKTMQLRFEPLGVVAVISPWNYPFALATGPTAAALMAGNAVILKPSPHTPLVAQRLAELLRQAGLPSGLFQLLHIEDRDAEALTGHPGIDKIIFTGSVATGRKVMASAARSLTPVVLELGGKDAALVAPDADLKRAVPGIVWYGMVNAGQTCASVERVYVHEAIYERFVNEAAALVESLDVGEEGAVGPLTTEAQLRTVEAHVEEARAMGARVLVGGHRVGREGLFYAPTLLVDVTPEMAVMREESFGPLLPIMRVASMEEAIREANRLSYGLSASIWTSDEAAGLAWAREVRAGAVNVNDHSFHFGESEAGWGGVGESGFGRTHGEAGLMEMVNRKFLSADPRRGALEPWWYPYDDVTAHLLRNWARALYGPAKRRPWALLSLLLNPRTWQRVDLLRLVANIRKLL